MPIFALGHRNRSSALPYGEAHRRFTSRLRIDDAYLERMYGSKLATHFYSDAERARFRARWD